jgi:hypothetical protein
MRRAAIVLAVLIAMEPAALAEEPRPPKDLEVVARGGTVQASIGMSRAGYRILGDLGGETVGMRTFDERWLLAWDFIVTGRVGVLANTEPYLPIFGAHARAFIEPAYRFSVGSWSPVVSARLDGDGSLVFNPTAGPSELQNINDMDGVGGVNGRGLVRAGAGASFLDAAHAFLVQAFAEELFESHGQNREAAAFTQGGLSLRFDWTWGLSASLQGTVGTTIPRTDGGLDRTTRTTRFGLSGDARKIFKNGMWIGLWVFLERDLQTATYEDTGNVFDTASPADFTLGLSYGFSLWKAK